MKYLKTFETYKGDVAIENVLIKAMGDKFLENKDEILDFIYSTLAVRFVNLAVDSIIEEYPELEEYKDEFKQACIDEGYNDSDISPTGEYSIEMD